MLSNIAILLLTVLAVPGSVIALSPKGKQDYCIDLGLIGKDTCDILSMSTLTVDVADAKDFPGVTNTTSMYLYINAKDLLDTPDFCYKVTYISFVNTTLQVRLPNGLTCVELQFRPGRWCTGNCPSGRRLQEEAVIMNEDDAMFQEYSTKCADYEYDVSLYVDTHLMAVASPKQDAIAAGCPLVATHSTYDPVTDKHEKEMLIWEDETALEEAGAYLHADSYSIGTFKGSELANAHSSIDISEVMKGRTYDIVSNNCAAYMLALAKSLNIKVDAKMTAFVTRRLLQSSGADFVDRIRNSVDFMSLFGGRQLRASEMTLSDHDIIELLVERNSAGLI